MNRSKSSDGIERIYPDSGERMFITIIRKKEKPVIYGKREKVLWCRWLNDSGASIEFFYQSSVSDSSIVRIANADQIRVQTR